MSTHPAVAMVDHTTALKSTSSPRVGCWWVAQRPLGCLETEINCAVTVVSGAAGWIRTQARIEKKQDRCRMGGKWT